MAAKKNKSKKAKKKKAEEPADQSRTISDNRKARHKFEIIEKLECGIQLVGSEVKSLRDSRVSLDEAYVRVKDSELWLVGADIGEYRQANIWNHDRRRPRKLLAHRRQLKALMQRTLEKGMTLVPLKMYFNARGLVKVIVGVCRGKKMHDKRESLKKADNQRDIQREMRRSGRRL
ncbi:MAG: SsrA-binding protein SmpB [Planctomycetota bacterium]